MYRILVQEIWDYDKNNFNNYEHSFVGGFVFCFNDGISRKFKADTNIKTKRNGTKRTLEQKGDLGL